MKPLFIEHIYNSDVAQKEPRSIPKQPLNRKILGNDIKKNTKDKLNKYENEVTIEERLLDLLWNLVHVIVTSGTNTIKDKTSKKKKLQKRKKQVLM